MNEKKEKKKNFVITQTTKKLFLMQTNQGSSHERLDRNNLKERKKGGLKKDKKERMFERKEKKENFFKSAIFRNHGRNNIAVTPLQPFLYPSFLLEYIFVPTLMLRERGKGGRRNRRKMKEKRKGTSKEP